MTHTNQFPLSVFCNFYYASQTEYRQHFENKEPVVLTEEEFNAAVEACEANKEKYVIVYEHQLIKKLDYWDAFPESITLEELDFMYAMNLINQEVYLTHKANLLNN